MQWRTRSNIANSPVILNIRDIERLLGKNIASFGLVSGALSCGGLLSLSLFALALPRCGLLVPLGILVRQAERSAQAVRLFGTELTISMADMSQKG